MDGSSRSVASKVPDIQSKQAALPVMALTDSVEEPSPSSTRNEEARMGKANSLKHSRARDEADMTNLVRNHQWEADATDEDEPRARKHRRFHTQTDISDDEHFWATQEEFLASQNNFFAESARSDSLISAPPHDSNPWKNAEQFTPIGPKQVDHGQRSRYFRGSSMHVLKKYDPIAHDPTRHSHPQPEEAAQQQGGVAVPAKASLELSRLDQENLRLSKKSEEILLSIPKERLDAPNEDVRAWRANIGSDEPDLQDMSLFPGSEDVGGHENDVAESDAREPTVEAPDAVIPGDHDN